MLLSNSYTAQSSLSQGRELDRVASKLDRAQGNVAAAERDLRTFLGALGETWGRWVDGWKTFCDEAQDLEEERIDFLKDVCWAYANAVSSVCVVDDEVRRVSLSRRPQVRRLTLQMCVRLCLRPASACASRSSQSTPLPKRPLLYAHMRPQERSLMHHGSSTMLLASVSRTR